MNAEPLLHRIAKVLAEHRLETVMIGNSAAALHGAPVTTLDIDFMFRNPPANLTKLKKVARSLDASILKPYYPVSDFYRVVNDDNGMQLDFMASYMAFARLRVSKPGRLASTLAITRCWLRAWQI